MMAPSEEQQIQLPGKDRAPSKEERKACWNSRDDYWKCMDRYGRDVDRCKNLREHYEHACPTQWVRHFDRKYQYEQYKQKVEKEGFEPITDNPAPPRTPNISNSPKKPE